MSRIAPLPWRVTPEEVILRWPISRPLAALWSGRAHTRWARWSFFAQPSAWLLGRSDGAAIIGNPPPEFLSLDLEGDPLRVLRQALDLCTPMQNGSRQRLDQMPAAQAPFQRGWIVSLSYELGRIIEPAAVDPGLERRPQPDREWPLYALGWCDGSIAYDHLTSQWWNCAAEVDLIGALESNQVRTDSCSIGPVHSNLSAAMYQNMVAQAIEYIRAGDIFQANITQRLSANFNGSARALTARAMRISQAWYGSHFELPEGMTIISMSPELFLSVDGSTREVITRPIKGSLAAPPDQTTISNGAPAVRVGDELRRSEKDTAELNMIIDLMRNDLGRVCQIGSIQVPAGRIIEQHPTIQHGVGEVRGRLRADRTLADLIEASFPAGSITGAPKIRAMQIIESLEQTNRGPYCGSVGYVDCSGNACLNVGIRTMLLQGGRLKDRFDLLCNATLDYAVGAGIVADSQPLAEYNECMDKAAVFLRIAESAPDVNPPVVSVEAAAAQRHIDRSDQPQIADAPG